MSNTSNTSPPTASRCLLISRFPEPRITAVLISRWVEGVLDGTVLQAVEFDHPKATATLRFLSAENAVNPRRQFATAVSSGAEWKALKVQFEPVLTSIAR